MAVVGSIVAFVDFLLAFAVSSKVSGGHEAVDALTSSFGLTVDTL
jgi:hypothetical protein